LWKGASSQISTAVSNDVDPEDESADTVVIVTMPPEAADASASAELSNKVASKSNSLKKRKSTPAERQSILNAKTLATLKTRASSMASCANYVLSLIKDHALVVNDNTSEYCFSISERYITSEEKTFYEERSSVAKIFALLEEEISRMPSWEPLRLPAATEKQKQRIEESLKEYDESLKRAEAKYKDILTRKGIKVP
jgi:hypothetical protein